MGNNDDFLTSGESVLATTFYTRGPGFVTTKLTITNRRLIIKRRPKIGRPTFEGDIPFDTIVSFRYSRETPLVDDPKYPCLFIKHTLPDGNVTESRIRLQSGRAFQHTPQQIYELIQNLVSQTADANGMRHPSPAIQQQLEKTRKRARRFRATTLMAVTFTISGRLTTLVYSLVTGEMELPKLVTLLPSINWFTIMSLSTILLWSFLLSTSMAAIPIYFLIDDPYLDSSRAIHWVIVGIVYALLWQFSSSLFHHLDIPTPCLVSILLRALIAGLAYLLVFRLFLRMQEKEGTAQQVL
jgi:hypothetical protein